MPHSIFIYLPIYIFEMECIIGHLEVLAHPQPSSQDTACFPQIFLFPMKKTSLEISYPERLLPKNLICIGSD